MLGTAGCGRPLMRLVLVRNPGGSFQEAPVPEGGEGWPRRTAVRPEHRRRSLRRSRKEKAAGAFVVPSTSAIEGARCCTGTARAGTRGRSKRRPRRRKFEVLAISASSLRRLAARAHGRPWRAAFAVPAQDQRQRAGWAPVVRSPAAKPGAAIEFAGETLDEPGGDQAQLLTVTSSGGLARCAAARARAPASLFFTPKAKRRGSFTGGWCEVPASSSRRHRTGEQNANEHPLPEPLRPTTRCSFAWPGRGPRRTGRHRRLRRRSCACGRRMAAVNSLGGADRRNRSEVRRCLRELIRRLARQPLAPGAHDDAGRRGAEQAAAVTGPVPLRADRACAAARRRGRCGIERSAGGRRSRRGRAYHPGKGGSRRRSRRRRKTPDAAPARCRVAHSAAELRRRRHRKRRRGHVAVAW